MGIDFRGYNFYKIDEKGYSFHLDNDCMIEANKFNPLIRPFLTLSAKFSGMFFRDDNVVNLIKEKKIKNVIDIGGDKGGLAKKLLIEGVKTLVYEPNPKSIKELKKNLIPCVKLDLEGIIRDNLFTKLSSPKSTAIICMNFTHVKWENEKLKKHFFKTVNCSGSALFVFSCVGPIPKELSNYEEIFEFNPFSKFFNIFTKLIYIFQKLRFRKIIFLKDLLLFLEFIKIMSEYFLMQRAVKLKDFTF